MLEAFTQPCFQRGLEFFIDGSAHFIELGGVAGLQLRQLRLECLPHFGHAAGVRFTQARQLQTQGVGQVFLQQRQLLAEGVNLRVLGARHIARLRQQGLLKN